MSTHPFRRCAPVLGIALAVPLAAAAPAGAAPASVPAALRVSAPTRALAPGPQPFLAGLTSQDVPVLLRFSRDGSILTRAVTTLHLRCTSGAAFWSPDGFSNVTVTSRRTVRVRFELPPQANDDGTTTVVSGGMDARVDRTASRASGTWQSTLVEKDTATAAVKDTCTTGVVRFSVHR
jgi:hypothetical protein